MVRHHQILEPSDSHLNLQIVRFSSDTPRTTLRRDKEKGVRGYRGQKSENAVRCSGRFIFLSIFWEESALEENMKVVDIFTSFPTM